MSPDIYSHCCVLLSQVNHDVSWIIHKHLMSKRKLLLTRRKKLACQIAEKIYMLQKKLGDLLIYILMKIVSLVFVSVFFIQLEEIRINLILIVFWTN